MIDLTSSNFMGKKEKRSDEKMVQQVKEKLVWNDIVERKSRNLNKQIERKKAQVKMEEFLKKLNKEHKQVRKDLERRRKKVEMNSKYLEFTVSIQKIGYQQVYRNIGIF